tara:strand:+ start:5125 stop:5277 length:153 start_codon:yes stop_codon:yes gene_type:complete
MLGFVQWLYETKGIKTKDIDWYSITKLFGEYKQYQKDEEIDHANGRKKKV